MEVVKKQLSRALNTHTPSYSVPAASSLSASRSIYLQNEKLSQLWMRFRSRSIARGSRKVDARLRNIDRTSKINTKLESAYTATEWQKVATGTRHV
jgi:hypothetical protein